MISLIKPIVIKMKRITFFIVLIFSTFIASSQIQLHAYRVTFADKNNSPYSIERPEEFLSPRALDKRARFNIPVTEEDLPVNPQYLNALQNVDSRIQLLSVSKWTNTATILCPDTMVITGVQMLPFVTSTLKVAKYDEGNTNPVSGNRTNHASTLPKTDIDTTSYGYSFGQIAIHNGHLLHDAGFRGEGMLIAVLDGGWLNMDNIGAFQPLYENNQVIGTYDLIPFSDNVYTMHGHGTLVTSEMAVSIQDTFVGAAPAANYVLIRSEDTRSEQPIEEDFWARGAELADSLGADVISSSLGYTQFPDFDEYDFDYSSCDGTSICSRAATMAAHRGIVVCIAAGNEGMNEWHKLSRPSDAEDILCVGAINVNSVYAPFSGVGPSYDGRVKPDVVAVGWDCYFWASDDSIVSGNGTSCATPIIGALSACLWQALPEYNSLEITQIIRENSHQFLMPDTLLGYGIPNYWNAYINNVDTTGMAHFETEEHYMVFPNPTKDKVTVIGPDIREVAIYDLGGRCLKRQNGVASQRNSVEIDLTSYISGIYLLRIVNENGASVKKIIKIND